MGVSYSVYLGPAIVISNAKEGWIVTEEIGERLAEVRREIRNKNGIRYMIANVGGHGIDVEPKFDHEDKPVSMNAEYIQEALDRFNKNFADDIEWLQKQFPDSKLSVEFLFMMDAS